MPAVELIQTHFDLSPMIPSKHNLLPFFSSLQAGMKLEVLRDGSRPARSAWHTSLEGWGEPPEKLSLAIGGIVLACFLLVVSFASTDTLVSIAIFLDLFMTTILTPLAPTLTSSYQLIALLTSSKNIVTCLIAPFTGHFIDGHEARLSYSGKQLTCFA